MTILKAVGLDFRFDDRKILSFLDLEISTGDFVCLLGPSGCGKSTLLRLFAGLLKPSGGRIENQALSLSVVFQDPRLLPWRTVRENVALPFELTNRAASGVDEVLAQVGLLEAANLFPHQLSGGMKQRTALARSLVTGPDMLLMDEPFSALDESLRLDLQKLIRDLWMRRKMTVLFVTHSLTEAVALGERILVMSRRGGKILSDRKINLADRSEDSRTGEAFNAEVRSLSKLMRSENSL